MADKMYVIITARKEVPDRDAGRAIYDLVKQKLIERPDILLSGMVTNHFDLDGD